MKNLYVITLAMLLMPWCSFAQSNNPQNIFNTTIKPSAKNATILDISPDNRYIIYTVETKSDISNNANLDEGSMPHNTLMLYDCVTNKKTIIATSDDPFEIEGFGKAIDVNVSDAQYLKGKVIFVTPAWMTCNAIMIFDIATQNIKLLCPGFSYSITSTGSIKIESTTVLENRGRVGYDIYYDVDGNIIRKSDYYDF